MHIAALTMTYNESVFLPIWLRHYGSQIGYGNLFVIDDGSTDGSTAGLDAVNVLGKGRAALDEDFRARHISAIHRELLKYYDVVLFTDTDEILVADPEHHPSLGAYLESASPPYVSATGVNVVHNRWAEAPLDFDRPLLAQRRFGQFDPWYCKSLISRVRMEWSPGFHTAWLAPLHDPHLYLFHLRAMDVDIALERQRNLNTVAFSQHSIERRHGYHFQMTGPQYLDYVLPFSRAEMDAASPAFDFTDQVGIVTKRGGGKLVRIPERFAETIQLVREAPAEARAATTAPASPSRPPFATLYEDATRRLIRSIPGLSRNEPCPCGSGRRVKHCHGDV